MARAMLRRSFALLVLLLLFVTPASPALTQETPPPDPVPQEQAEQTAEEQPLLEEIVVTAQKREENVQDVPAAVTTVNEETLNVITGGGADVKALSGRVPSLMIESSFGRAFPRFYIRGLGNTDFDLNASQPVSMYYDEVVLENPVVKGMPLWDLDRIEVLRGPQGTLFGRNTPAGLIKFESKKPSQELEAYAQGSIGTYNTTDIKGAVGGGLTDTLSARFSFLYQSQDDWIDNGFTGENDALGGYDNLAYRLQFLWEPTIRFSALVNLHGWDVDGTARVFRANIIKPGTNDLVDGFDQETVFQDGLNKQDISSQGSVIKMDYDFDTGTLTSVTAFESLDMFSRGDIDGGFGAVFAPPSGPGFIPFPSESADGIPNLDQFTQEIRYASNTESPLQWLVGAFFFDEDLDAETFSYASLAPGNPVEGYATQTQSAESYAFFASFDYKPSPHWAFKGGLRYTNDKKEFSAERPDPTFQLPTFAPVTASTDDDFINWDISATYAASENVNWYGRIATGSRAPSIQGRILFAPDFEGGANPATNGVSVADTETNTSAEFGVKTELLNKSLRVNADVYIYEVKDQQLTAVGGAFNVATLLNADKTEGYGFESDINWAPNRSWLVTLGFSYNHTEINDPELTVAACGGGCTMRDPVVEGLAFIDGNSLPHAPEIIFNGIIDYKRPVGAGQFISSLDWSYYDDKQFFLYESEEFHADGFELGLRFGYGWNDGKYEVAAYGRNVTDEEIVQNGIDFNNLTGMMNDPAIFGMEFIARF
ncbi:MAG: TonB-dependent receptor [Acidobacteria bacterium]|nr:TonB-dependent receptor [Acidobacteriota bacterium]